MINIRPWLLSGKYRETLDNELLAQRAAGKTVLVACGAGISRSTSFAIAALKEAESLPLLAAAREVRKLHPDGLPHMALWSSLCLHYQEPMSTWRSSAPLRLAHRCRRQHDTPWAKKESVVSSAAQNKTLVEKWGHPPAFRAKWGHAI
jgi:hypothetical protein